MDEWRNQILEINGMLVKAWYREATVQGIFIPLLRHMTALQAAKGQRIVVFLAAPPAAGKSTLAAYLQALSEETPGVQPIQALGMDGFHHHADYIAAHTVAVSGQTVPMQSVKGCPESFNLPRLQKKLSALRTTDIWWPVYDRRRHDVIEDALQVKKSIILIEGNWLLLDEDGWRTLRDQSDLTVMIKADETVLKERLIQRKIRGGMARQAAENFYEQSDRRNILRVLAHALPADITLYLREDNDYAKEYES